MRFRDIPVYPEPIVPESIVDHPRYGKTPHRSESKIDLDAWGHWHYARDRVFISSAIPADLTLQTSATVQTEFYVDTLETCVSCHRPFLFFAVEQKHWFEELGFGLDSWCVRCVECRKKDQTLRRRFRRFSEAVIQKDLESDLLATLIRDAIFLWDNGVLVNRDKLNRLRNIARRKIPLHEATREIEAKIAQLGDLGG